MVPAADGLTVSEAWVMGPAGVGWGLEVTWGNAVAAEVLAAEVSPEAQPVSTELEKSAVPERAAMPWMSWRRVKGTGGWVLRGVRGGSIWYRARCDCVAPSLEREFAAWPGVFGTL